jgi:hypothetical protein
VVSNITTPPAVPPLFEAHGGAKGMQIGLCAATGRASARAPSEVVRREDHFMV